MSIGTSVGRYIVTQTLGAGAMGVVYAAYDPKLDRKVALKLLKPDGDHAAARQRLQREAQALAKLDHRNVVGVYDVGTYVDQLFVAMEFIAGRDLAVWLREREQPRPWREVVGVFMAAGEGLAAAHDAGLIHRDFKPANVMLGDDGRVRVMDFGLARSGRQSDTQEREVTIEALLESDLTSATGSELLRRTVTRAGALIGTPAYMAPELLGAQPASALSDQFAFCVALFEGLYGQRPYAGNNFGQLLMAMKSGTIVAPTRGVSVPPWLRKIVVRGLAHDPHARWPSMQALLAALANDPLSRRRRALVAAGIVAALAGSSWLAAQGSEPSAPACAGFERHLDDVWDEGARARVRAGLERSGSDYASGAAELVTSGLDVYTLAWVQARTEACEASERGEQSEALLDLRMACLDERLLHVREFVGALADADAAMVDEAVDALDELPTLARCDDAEALRAEHPPPEDPAMAAQVAELDADIVRLQTLMRLGKVDEAVELGEQIRATARELDYAPLQVRVGLELGKLSIVRAEYEPAEHELREAYALAVELTMKHEAAELTLQLVSLFTAHLSRYDEARRWAEHAGPWTAASGAQELRLGFLHQRGSLALHEGELEQARASFETMLEQSQGLPSERARALTSLGHVANERGDFAGARQLYEQTLAQRLSDYGPEHPRTALALLNLGRADASLEQLEQAEQHYERARQIWLRSFGPAHPDVAMVEANLANLVVRRSDYPRALELYEGVLVRWEQTFGPEHPKVALLLSNMAECLRNMDELERAEANYARASAVIEAALGRDHPMFGLLEFNRGLVAMDRGEHVAAEAIFERALVNFQAAKGPEHVEVARVLRALVSARLALGQTAELQPMLERALAIDHAQLGPDAFAHAATLTLIGRVAVRTGEPGRAIEALERGLALREAGPPDPLARADNQYWLARALWDAAPKRGQDRERARELLEQAREGFGGGGERGAAQLAELERWAAGNGAASP